MILLSLIKRREETMIIDGMAGVLGLTSLVGGIGGAACFLAVMLPSVGLAVGALGVVAGLHTWITRKK